MRLIKILPLVLFFLVTAKVNAHITLSHPPVKTVIIKDPAAANTAAYFSTANPYTFWVYKAGTTEDVTKITDVFKKDKAVQNCTNGETSGDYTQITLTLKTAKNKEWFITHFKKAGLDHVKINNDPVVDTEKM